MAHHASGHGSHGRKTPAAAARHLTRRRMSKRIEDYGLIGNLVSCALVGKDGSIDWLCLPRFDSDACFAALVGKPEHGRWLITPGDKGPKISRRYLPETAVLETTFETADGAATLTDFMPLGAGKEE